eukprot:1278573-Rhodomonas_salina.2
MLSIANLGTGFRFLPTSMARSSSAVKAGSFCTASKRPRNSGSESPCWITPLRMLLLIFSDKSVESQQLQNAEQQLQSLLISAWPSCPIVECSPATSLFACSTRLPAQLIPTRAIRTEHPTTSADAGRSCVTCVRALQACGSKASPSTASATTVQHSAALNHRWLLRPRYPSASCCQPPASR